MKIFLEKDTIKHFSSFTSKEKTRPLLTGVSIKDNNGQLEIAATDGSIMAVMRRPFMSDEVAPVAPVVVVLPKAVKGGVWLENMEGKTGFFVYSGIKDRGVCEGLAGTYPNYNIVLPADVTKLELASRYAIFNPKKIQAIYDVLDDMPVPYHNNASDKNPYFFAKEDAGQKWRFAIMSIKHK